MSITESEEKVVDFLAKRREMVIRAIIQSDQFPKEQIYNIIQMHEFLSAIDHAEAAEEDFSKNFEKIEHEVQIVREKFEELFEIVKDELLIRR